MDIHSSMEEQWKFHSFETVETSTITVVSVFSGSEKFQKTFFLPPCSKILGAEQIFDFLTAAEILKTNTMGQKRLRC